MNENLNITPIFDPKATAKSLTVKSLDQIQPISSSKYLIEDWLTPQDISLLYGASNAGKSFVALDMSLSIATGRDWFGNQASHGGVVYVAIEGALRFQNRVLAWTNYHSDSQSAQFWLVSGNVDLWSNQGAQTLHAALQGLDFDLLVIDTLSRTFGAGDENSVRDVTQYLNNVAAIGRAFNSHVMLIHHSGKNEGAGARGSSALRCAVDTEIAVGGGEIKATKQRDSDIPPSLFYEITGREIGLDGEGRSIESAIARQTEAKVSQRSERLAGRFEIGLNVLREMIS